jgi:hypothetical protein
MNVKSERKRCVKASRQTEVNEVPLSEELQEDLDKFLQGVNAEPTSTEAFVIIFRPGGNGTVNVNVASWELTEELQNKMVDAIHKTINGEPLFYEFE